MNAIDGLFNFFTGFLNKASSFIPSINIPFDKYSESWGVVSKYIYTANVFLPIDAFITIMGIILSFIGVMIIIWLITFLLDQIPFF
ncbi:MAG: hypothetical protein ACRCST_17600 [Turicibacter sp.]